MVSPGMLRHVALLRTGGDYATRCNIPEDAILHEAECLRSYTGPYLASIAPSCLFKICFIIILPINAWHGNNLADFFHCVRFEVFTEVTMKNAVFWDIKTQFVLHRRHITSLLHSPAS
jgi:hypothetical protein